MQTRDTQLPRETSELLWNPAFPHYSLIKNAGIIIKKKNIVFKCKAFRFATIFSCFHYQIGFALCSINLIVTHKNLTNVKVCLTSILSYRELLDIWPCYDYVPRLKELRI